MALEIVCPGCTLLSFSDGEELEKHLFNTSAPPPDLVVLDINMPMLDGLQVLADIRAKKQFEDLPVVICSTSKSPADIGRAYTAGASYYIIKQFDLESLKNEIRHMLSCHMCGYAEHIP